MTSSRFLSHYIVLIRCYQRLVLLQRPYLQTSQPHNPPASSAHHGKNALNDHAALTQAVPTVAARLPQRLVGGAGTPFV
jgi:hypothetical protein